MSESFKERYDSCKRCDVRATEAFPDRLRPRRVGVLIPVFTINSADLWVALEGLLVLTDAPEVGVRPIGVIQVNMGVTIVSNKG